MLVSVDLKRHGDQVTLAVDAGTSAGRSNLRLNGHHWRRNGRVRVLSHAAGYKSSSVVHLARGGGTATENLS